MPTPNTIGGVSLVGADPAIRPILIPDKDIVIGGRATKTYVTERPTIAGIELSAMQQEFTGGTSYQDLVTTTPDHDAAGTGWAGSTTFTLGQFGTLMRHDGTAGGPYTVRHASEFSSPQGLCWWQQTSGLSSGLSFGMIISYDATGPTWIEGVISYATAGSVDSEIFTYNGGYTSRASGSEASAHLNDWYVAMIIEGGNTVWLQTFSDTLANKELLQWLTANADLTVPETGIVGFSDAQSDDAKACGLIPCKYDSQIL